MRRIVGPLFPLAAIACGPRAPVAPASATANPVPPPTPASTLANSDLPPGDDLALIRKRYVGRPLWAMGPIGRRDVDEKVWTPGIEPGMKLVLAHVRPASPQPIIRSGAFAPEMDLEAVAAEHPVRLEFRPVRFEKWGGETHAVRCVVIDLADLEHLFSPTPPPAWMRGGSRPTRPEPGWRPDDVAWLWGWPPIRRPKAEMRRMGEWRWGPSFHSREVWFQDGEVRAVSDFPDLP